MGAEADAIRNKRFPDEFFRLLPLLCLILIVVLGVALRGRGIRAREMEYDEAWTLKKYVASHQTPWEIINNLKVPNNHPLHSLLVRSWCRFGGVHCLSLRFPPFVFGSLTIVVTMLSAFLLFNNGWAAFWSGTVVAFNGAMVHYSQTSRGYALQSFWIVCFVASLTAIEKKRVEASSLLKVDIAFLIVITIVFSTLTLPTSVIFLIPIALCHLAFVVSKNASKHWRSPGPWITVLNKRKTLVVAYVVSAAICATWYFANLSDLAAAKDRFGARLNGFSDFISLAWAVVSQVVGTPFAFLPLLLLFSRRHRRLAGAYVVCAAFPVMTSVILGNGGARVFVPLVIVAALGCGGLPDVIKRLSEDPRRRLIALSTASAALVVVCGFKFNGAIKRWTPREWGKTAKKVFLRTPRKAYVVFPPAAGFPLLINYPDVLDENLARLPTGPRALVVVGDDAISGTAGDGSVESIQMPSRSTQLNIDGTTVEMYRMIPVDERNRSRPINILWARLGPAPVSVIKAICQDMTSTRWLMLNPWFSSQNLKTSKFGKVTVVNLITDNPLSIETARRLEAKWGSTLQFFQIAPFSD